MRRHEEPRFGTEVLKGDVPTKLGTYGLWLERTLDAEQPAAVAFERPILMPSDTTQLVLLLTGLPAITYFIRYKRGLMCREVSIHDAKFALAGSGRASKDEMIHGAMSTMKWTVEDHHQADAGAVGLCAYDSLWPK